MIAAILLAAGKSERMGSPKALLQIGGRTLLRRAIDNCQQAGIDRIVVVLGHHENEIREGVDLADVSVVVNIAPERGQTSSVQTGLVQVSDCEAVLLYPVDFGLVQAGDVIALLAAAQAAPRAPIVQPEFDGKGGHPVLLRASVCGEVLALDTALGVNAVTHAHAGDVLRVPTRNPWTIRDIDTPEEYRAALNDAGGLA